MSHMRTDTRGQLFRNDGADGQVDLDGQPERLSNGGARGGIMAGDTRVLKRFHGVV
jgi:hypothetical protein